jgi:hypothetical protein
MMLREAASSTASEGAAPVSLIFCITIEFAQIILILICN